MRKILIVVLLLMPSLFFSQSASANAAQRILGCAPVTKSSPQECMRYRICCRGICSRAARGHAIAVCSGECLRRYQACMKGDISRNR